VAMIVGTVALLISQTRKRTALVALALDRRLLGRGDNSRDDTLLRRSTCRLGSSVRCPWGAKEQPDQEVDKAVT
jgi:hypothetical protein